MKACGGKIDCPYSSKTGYANRILPMGVRSGKHRDYWLDVFTGHDFLKSPDLITLTKTGEIFLDRAAEFT
jgi:hypothetical protein